MMTKSSEDSIVAVTHLGTFLSSGTIKVIRLVHAEHGQLSPKPPLQGGDVGSEPTEKRHAMFYEFTYCWRSSIISREFLDRRSGC